MLSRKNDLTLENKDQILAQYTPEIQRLDAETSQLKTEITTKENEVNALYDTFISEAEGTAGTGLLGKGPVYEEKREKHDAALAQLAELRTANQAKIVRNETQKETLQEQYNAAVHGSQPIIDGFDGLMARIDAMKELPWWSTQKKRQREILTETDHIVNDRVYTDIASEEDLYNYKKKMAKEIMKRQQDSFYRRQTKILG